MTSTHKPLYGPDPDERIAELEAENARLRRGAARVCCQSEERLQQLTIAREALVVILDWNENSNSFISRTINGALEKIDGK